MGLIVHAILLCCTLSKAPAGYSDVPVNCDSAGLRCRLGRAGDPSSDMIGGLAEGNFCVERVCKRASDPADDILCWTITHGPCALGLQALLPKGANGNG